MPRLLWYLKHPPSDHGSQHWSHCLGSLHAKLVPSLRPPIWDIMAAWCVAAVKIQKVEQEQEERSKHTHPNHGSRLLSRRLGSLHAKSFTSQVCQFGTSWRHDAWRWCRHRRRNRSRRRGFLLDAISRIDQSWRPPSSYGPHEAHSRCRSIQQSANMLSNRLVLLNKTRKSYQ